MEEFLWRDVFTSILDGNKLQDINGMKIIIVFYR